MYPTQCSFAEWLSFEVCFSVFLFAKLLSIQLKHLQAFLPDCIQVFVEVLLPAKEFTKIFSG